MTAKEDDHHDENIYRNDCVFEYIESVPCMCMTVYGYQTSKSLRQVSEKMLELAIQHNVHKLCVDTTYMKIMGKDDQDWIVNEFLHRVMEQGTIRVSSIVQSKYFFNRIALQEVGDRIYHKGFIQRVFDKKEEALVWLKNACICDDDDPHHSL